MSKANAKKERITIRLTPWQMQCLTELKENLNTSYSLLTRSIIGDFLQRNEETLEKLIIQNKLKSNANNKSTQKDKEEE